MARPPGSKSGPYEIIAPLAKGGIGEVYMARNPGRQPDWRPDMAFEHAEPDSIVSARW